MSKMKHSKPHHEEEGGEAWLLPYSDLMTLLLAVFIVLFAVSKVDQNKADELAGAFQENMTDGFLLNEGDSMIDLFPTESGGATPQAGSEGVTPGAQEELSDEELEQYLGKAELSNLKEVEEQLNEQLENEGMTDVVTTRIDSRGLIISLNNAILFDSGSAEIKLENEETLKKIAITIDELDNYIRIEGHTDNRPISTAIYPSNWELSTARAASVVRLFINECSVSPEKVVAVGYGEYRPVGDNKTEEGRKMNRRIDIIVLSQKYDNLEN
jgi:chemotaxis protein MotB